MEDNDAEEGQEQEQEKDNKDEEGEVKEASDICVAGTVSTEIIHCFVTMLRSIGFSSSAKQVTYHKLRPNCSCCCFVVIRHRLEMLTLLQHTTKLKIYNDYVS